MMRVLSGFSAPAVAEEVELKAETESGDEAENTVSCVCAGSVAAAISSLPPLPPSLTPVAAVAVTLPVIGAAITRQANTTTDTRQ
jgi:hypothetical protein